MSSSNHPTHARGSSLTSTISTGSFSNITSSNIISSSCKTEKNCALQHLRRVGTMLKNTPTSSSTLISEHKAQLYTSILSTLYYMMYDHKTRWEMMRAWLQSPVYNDRVEENVSCSTRDLMAEGRIRWQSVFTCTEQQCIRLVQSWKIHLSSGGRYICGSSLTTRTGTPLGL